MRISTYIVFAAMLMTRFGEAKADPLTDLAASADNDTDKLILAGDLYVEAMRLSEAKKMYKQATWKNKDNPEARLGVIRLSMAEGKFQQTKHYCRKLTQA